MRELKLRAWDTVSREWVETINIRGEKNSEFNIYSFPITPAEIRNNLIIELSTGVKDKNGKDIYEGDIVRCYSRRKLLGDYQVIWNEGCGGFECESLKALVDGGGRMLKDVRVFNEISIQFRVIGNIHENRDLLEEE